MERLKEMVKECMEQIESENPEQFDEQEAFDYGLVSKIYAKEIFHSRVDEYIKKMVTRDRVALSAVKEYLNLAPGKDYEIAARYASNLLSGVLASQ